MKCPKCGGEMNLGDAAKSLPDGTEVYFEMWVCPWPPYGCGHEEKVKS